MGHGSSSQEVCEGTGVLNEGFLKILIISVDIIELLGVGCERNFDYIHVAVIIIIILMSRRACCIIEEVWMQLRRC